MSARPIPQQRGKVDKIAPQQASTAGKPVPQQRSKVENNPPRRNVTLTEDDMGFAIRYAAKVSQEFKFKGAEFGRPTFGGTASSSAPTRPSDIGSGSGSGFAQYGGHVNPAFLPQGAHVNPAFGRHGSSPLANGGTRRKAAGSWA
ncbi:hypothetical protein B0A48_07845 [Cryoendolithus antarcticus]|uniref:Uncharacterized protein n=1 Tax=Cryoendolithus antarcticus TaxID=1507870 RepID=A0A1V8T0T4_9PEZI|nr:hypothetical protein B0A48_07845 [Cryoendolithus antarcticus]